MLLDAGIPSGPLVEKWDRYRSECRLVAPANRGRYTLIVMGTGLAGAAAAASLAELGFRVLVFCLQDSPRRAHSISAQGGINAAKNYCNDGDSIQRLFIDTIKGGDFRAREANVFRLAHLSNNIIDQCVAQGVPFAREYGGLLANRSFGGAQVSRTFYCRGQTGQQLLLGAYGALLRQVRRGLVTILPRREMLDLVKVDGRARGIVARNLLTGAIESYSGHAVILATGGYGNVYYLSTNAASGNATAIWRAYKQGAGFANPCFVQIHPTCIPVHGDYQSKLTLMSESLRNDGRLWVPARPGDNRPPGNIPEEDRHYFLEEKYPAFGNLVPRDVASRSTKEQCDLGRGVGPTGRAVYLDLSGAIARLGMEVIKGRYGNLFTMYERITGRNPYAEPMMIYPAVHYTMGGLWVDYGLMSTIPGLFVLGEANFSDHGANRLGASALMQGLADGYFIVPPAIGNYLAQAALTEVSTEHREFSQATVQAAARIEKLAAGRGKRLAEDFHRELGLLLWDCCGMARNEAGLKKALARVPEIRAEFNENLLVPGSGRQFNQNLERAGRVADFLELAELLATDALERRESCGCHFREESQTRDNEAARDDQHFSHVAVWEYGGGGQAPILHKEPLVFENVAPSERCYK